MAQRLIITKGPSKLDFMLSLFDGSRASKRSVGFAVEKPSDFDPSRKEDIDHFTCEGFLGKTKGNYLGFTGLVIYMAKKLDMTCEIWYFEAELESNRWVTFRGVYCTETREGWVAIKKNLQRIKL